MTEAAPIKSPPRRQRILAILAIAVLTAVASKAASVLVSEAVSEEPQAAPVLRVFLLAGQSNMQGHGAADLDDPKDFNGGRGNLVSLLADPEAGARWQKLRAADGAWAVRDDVFVIYETGRARKAGPLSVGFAVHEGQHHFGPELGIGQVLGDRYEDPVLLVKTAWGGKSLAVDFRPPSAGGEVGPYYTQMLAEFRAALADVAQTFPQFVEHETRLEGVIWFQGWNDGCDKDFAAEYEENLVCLIRDLRVEFGDPALPVVVGETGNIDNQVLRDAQKAACSRTEVGGGARFAPTFAFRRPAEDSPNTTHGHHWFGNAESYLLAGDALGRAMAELLDARAHLVK